MNQAVRQTPDDYQAAYTGAALFDLSARGKVELTGPDALAFLHNLCTNDIKNLPVGAGCEAFLTTAKARIVSFFLVGRYSWQGTDFLWLDTDPGEGAKLYHALDHYLISEQVELVDRTNDLAMLRLLGPKCHDLARSAFPQAQIPATNLGNQRTDEPGPGFFLRRFDSFGLPGLDVICTATEAKDIEAKLLGAGASRGSAATLEVLRVEAGFPRMAIDMDENRLVMEVGRTAQAICYTKGCFLGQEPIVMARDRGQVNRTLLGVTVADGEPLAAGTKLFQGETEVGQVTSSVFSPRLGKVIALAYLRRGNQTAGLELRVEDGRAVRVANLPFCT